MNEFGGKYEIGDEVILVENTQTEYKKNYNYILGQILTISSIREMKPNSNTKATCFYEVNGNSKANNCYWPLVEEQLIPAITTTLSQAKEILKSYDFKTRRLAIKKQLEIYRDEY